MFPRPTSPRDSRYSQRIPYINHTPLPTPLNSHSPWHNEPRSPLMGPDLLTPSPSQLPHNRALRRWRAVLRSAPLRSGILFGAVVFISLFLYTTVLSPRGSLWLRPPDWHGLSQNESLVPDLENTSPSASLSTPIPVETSPSPPPISDILTVEQIRDIVAPTRGFLTRDYSLGLGWNNMRYILDAAVLQADLLNRTLIIPSFVYARACQYDLSVCADYATMVNKGDAIGWEEWRELPYEQQMGFRIPISLMLDLPRLRQRYPIITASEYLRLHGQDPATESSSGFWLREWYIANPNVFEPNKTKTPSQFIIENHWYDPTGTNRVDYIPQAMKSRGKWERYPEPEIGETAGFWPPEEPTDISGNLMSALPEGRAILGWDAAKGVLRESRLGQEEVDLNDDDVVEGILNANGWEVLHTFDSVLGMEYAKTVVRPIRQVAHRSTIRGFRDDYYHVDSDVVVVAGETHLGRKPGAMRFTEEPARARFASMVVHLFVFPPKVLALAESLATRIRQMNDGRLWMGAHMRRGDFVRLGWAMESTPEAHVKRVKERLQNGRSVLEHLGNLSTYELAGARPDLEQVTLPPPLPEDRFYVATDERNPEGLQAIRDAGAVLLSDLLTMEDRREFGWPLMITDVRAIVEQAVLFHSAFFYGHAMSSLAGVVTNMRAARGADPRTMVLD